MTLLRRAPGRERPASAPSVREHPRRTSRPGTAGTPAPRPACAARSRGPSDVGRHRAGRSPSAIPAASASEQGHDADARTRSQPRARRARRTSRNRSSSTSMPAMDTQQPRGRRSPLTPVRLRRRDAAHANGSGAGGHPAMRLSTSSALMRHIGTPTPGAVVGRPRSRGRRPRDAFCGPEHRALAESVCRARASRPARSCSRRRSRPGPRCRARRFGPEVRDAGPARDLVDRASRPPRRVVSRRRPP